MRLWTPVSAFCLGLATSLMAQASPPGGKARRTAALDVTAAIVLDAVDVKRLPLVDFWLVSESGGDTVRLTTGLDGKAHSTPAPGRYRIFTPKPPVVRGVRYAWSQIVMLTSGQVLALELTNANALTDTVPVVAPPSTKPDLPSETVVYDRVYRGVVRITAGLGQGSGFFADTLGGVILTNDHVAGVPGAIYVMVDSVHRYEAQRLAHDHEADVAVLRITSSACPDCPRLRLASAARGQPLVKAGQPVIAIGFPLHQERTLTSGIVSSLREGAIISDVNINHGNSGGPLLDARGEVLAINTFGDIPQSAGPGISGSILLAGAANVLSRARDSLLTAPPPNPTPLPTLPLATFSLARLHAFVDSIVVASPRPGTPRAANIRGESPSRAPAASIVDDYMDLQEIDVGPFTVTLTTPVGGAVFQRLYAKDVGRDRQKREQTAGVTEDEGFMALKGTRDWEQYVGDARRPVVTLAVEPKSGETGGSLLKRFLLSPALQAKLVFEGDVRGVTLWRDSAIVPPLLGGHGPVEIFVNNTWVSMKDVADRGYYVFDPRAFRPEPDGRVPRVMFVIEDLKHPKDPACLALGRRSVARIWNDFEPYFAEHHDSVTFVRAAPALSQVRRDNLPGSVTGCRPPPRPKPRGQP